MFDFLSNAVVIARPIVTNPGVPAERVAALRRAFDATLADPAFLEDAARAEPGDRRAHAARNCSRSSSTSSSTPPEVLEQVARAIQIRNAEAVKGARPAE